MKMEPRSSAEEKMLALLRLMNDLSPLAMAYVAGAELIFRYVNPPFCRVVGRSSEELMGKPFAECVPEGEACREQLNRVCQTGEAEIRANPVSIDSPPGSLTYAMWPIPGDSGHLLGVMLQAEEITLFHQQAAAMNQALLLAGIRQHELREEADRQNAQLQLEVQERARAEQALQDFVETLEIRVAERTSEVRRQADRLRALASELSRVEQRERKRLAAILHDHVQQLIAAARMQLGMMQYREEPGQIVAAIENADNILREALAASRSLTSDLSPPVLRSSGLVGALRWLAVQMEQKHHMTVHLDLDIQAEPAAEEIRYLLFECARELLFNAVKHSGTHETEMSLALTAEGLIQVIVSDQGHGFDPELLQDRPPNELTFGLFSVQERLVHLGGQTIIEAAPGQGTKITLLSPTGVADAAPAEVSEASLAETPELMADSKSRTCRVLIVDDHRLVREGLASLLRIDPNIEVVGEAADGPRAIELATQLEPDIIIMDINLGGMNGIEATRRIVAQQPHTKVIGLSMHMDEHVAAEMRDAGACTYLSKGGRSEDLVAAIQTCASS